MDPGRTASSISDHLLALGLVEVYVLDALLHHPPRHSIHIHRTDLHQLHHLHSNLHVPTPGCQPHHSEFSYWHPAASSYSSTIEVSYPSSPFHLWLLHCNSWHSKTQSHHQEAEAPPLVKALGQFNCFQHFEAVSILPRLFHPQRVEIVTPLFFL